ncbi:hemerythrin family protein [bacterium]|nr:hemerythrin family protein [bacterium]HPF36197.1 bacteriohemerythrin [Candidatus Krumholzibacteria bacterium]HRX49890.1 bacteriohemerythrin [Candidatus Krumholzibacteria bacterium]
MALMSWNPTLSVDVDAMDREHQKLITLVNELNDAMKAGKAKDEMDRTFNALASYTQSHFASEERYMQSIGYPDLAAHKAEHAKLLQTVTEFKKEYDAGNATISMKLMGFLRDWVRNHIQKTDKKYGAHAKQPA